MHGVSLEVVFVSVVVIPCLFSCRLPDDSPLVIAALQSHGVSLQKVVPFFESVAVISCLFSCLPKCTSLVVAL